MKPAFTNTELRIIKLISRQLTSREIGEQLGLSYRTIEEYRLNIQKKIKAKNSIGIVIYAVKNNIIQIR